MGIGINMQVNIIGNTKPIPNTNFSELTNRWIISLPFNTSNLILCAKRPVLVT